MPWRICLKNRPYKQAEEEEGEEEDRISALSDCLILEILSRLDSTKQAIQTGDKTLSQCQSNNLNRFEILATYEKRFESRVGNWIKFVTSRNVQKLTLNLNQIGSNGGFVLKDESFLINSHFTRLDLGGCLFSPMKPISWNNLTQLTVSHLKLDQDSIANILSGSPLLHSLRLVKCYGLSWLEITSKNVKSLVVDGYVAPNPKSTIEINAPCISSLTIAGHLWLSKLLLRDLSSLVKADLNFAMFGDDGMLPEKDEDEMLNRLILNLRHVKELRIGSFCYKVVARLEVRGFNLPSNLKGVDAPLYRYFHSRALADCNDNNSFDSDASKSDSTVSGDSEEPLLEEVN